ncbi:SRPBCC family protein [Mycolicibacterium sp. F2034L]|uniref:SRPBCC family protein n=1 Tax=Mycolicibacterium sp. F2034L TaxID=2926422 RepID=UPI001FF3BB2B|nr:SRPBCC family protein [Mycolicibacterium sp. F2034L]MCK0172635.1 SRPBCC family protein [Mycolicibacterium sp. F2034L]
MAIRESREVVIEARADEILEVMLDLESLPQWSPAHLTSEILERDELGRPVRSRATVKTPVGVNDDAVIALSYHPDGYSWTLVSSTYQRSQDARYTLIPEGDSTRVRFEVTVDPMMPMPGFLLRRAAKGVLETATDGLRARVLEVVGKAK